MSTSQSLRHRLRRLQPPVTCRADAAYIARSTRSNRPQLALEAAKSAAHSGKVAARTSVVTACIATAGVVATLMVGYVQSKDEFVRTE